MSKQTLELALDAKHYGIAGDDLAQWPTGRITLVPGDIEKYRSAYKHAGLKAPSDASPTGTQALE